MELPPVCLAILLTILLFALALHAAGIYCLSQERSKLKKQKIILMNLSVVETVIIVFTMGHLGSANVKFELEDLEKVNQVLGTMYHSLTSVFYSSITLIPFDRLLCVVAPHIYQVYIRRSSLKKIVCFIWGFSLIWPIPFCFSPSAMHIHVIKYYSYGAQALFLVISFAAYSLICRSQSQRWLMQTHRSGDVAITKQTFYVSFSVTTSFVIFYLVPNYIPHSQDYVFETICIAVNFCGLAVDPVLYILLHSALRPIAYKLLTCKDVFRSRRTIKSIRARKNGMADLSHAFPNISPSRGQITYPRLPMCASSKVLSRFSETPLPYKETTV